MNNPMLLCQAQLVPPCLYLTLGKKNRAFFLYYYYNNNITMVLGQSYMYRPNDDCGVVVQDTRASTFAGKYNTSYTPKIRSNKDCALVMGGCRPTQSAPESFVSCGTQLRIGGSARQRTDRPDSELFGGPFKAHGDWIFKNNIDSVSALRDGEWRQNSLPCPTPLAEVTYDRISCIDPSPLPVEPDGLYKAASGRIGPEYSQSYLSNACGWFLCVISLTNISKP